MVRQDITIHLLLLRHGATAGNKEYRYIGWTDEPLSEEGIAGIFEKSIVSLVRTDLLQASDSMQALDSLHASGVIQKPGCIQSPDLLVVSPLTRCRQTAALIWPDKSQIIVENLKEMNFGRFEGKNFSDLNGDPDYQAWIDSNGTIAFPEGEDRAGFIARTMKGFDQMLQAVQKVEQEQKSIAAVVHGGTIMAILSSLTGGDYFSFQVKNGEGYQLKLLLGNRGDSSHETSILNELKLLEYRKI